MEPLLDENRKTDTPPRGPSLLDLPDELIARIFEDVGYDTAVDQPTRIMPPPRGICLNKRIFRIVLPLWYRSMRFVDGDLCQSRVDAFCAALVRTGHHRRWTRHLDVEHDSKHPALHTALLGTFRQLRSLVYWFDDGTSAMPHLQQLLRDLPLLESLEIPDPGGMGRLPKRATAGDFRLLRDSSVTFLKVYEVQTAVVILGGPHERRLQHVRMASGFSGDGEIPLLPWIAADRIIYKRELSTELLNDILDGLQNSDFAGQVRPLKLLALAVSNVHPMLCAFVKYLRDTQVVQFRLTHDTYTVKYWRASATEAFESDMVRRW
ncbi:hypothetical protein JCM10449v2_005661 [Rhodotorula kratochvilovae]